MKRKPRHLAHTGFSLMELLITLSIATIFVLMAYPNYHAYILQTHRLEAQTALLDLASRMEAFYTLNQTYASATIGTNSASDVLSCATSANGWYALRIVDATESSFALEATVTGGEAEDPLCQSFSYNSKGKKGASIGSVRECWV